MANQISISDHYGWVYDEAVEHGVEAVLHANLKRAVMKLTHQYVGLYTVYSVQRKIMQFAVNESFIDILAIRNVHTQLRDYCTPIFNLGIIQKAVVDETLDLRAFMAVIINNGASYMLTTARRNSVVRARVLEPLPALAETPESKTAETEILTTNLPSAAGPRHYQEPPPTPAGHDYGQLRVPMPIQVPMSHFSDSLETIEDLLGCRLTVRVVVEVGQPLQQHPGIPVEIQRGIERQTQLHAVSLLNEYVSACDEGGVAEDPVQFLLYHSDDKENIPPKDASDK